MKLLFDRSIGLLLFILLVIPILFVSIAIKITSKGSILYWSERVGKENVNFMMPKFRTMRSGTPQLATHLMNDPDLYLSPIGGIIRRSSLDEIPQLFSILKGDMSLVGPRPEQPQFVEQFQASIPRYMERHREKAGITGWAQVNGLRGDTSIEDRTRYDLWYVENWSLWLDFKIIIRTVFKVLSGTAY